MSKFWDDLLIEAREETIDAVVIGEMGWEGYGEDEIAVPHDVKGAVLSAEEAERHLSYEYDSGYGAPGCHSVYAWTPTRVIFVSQYDGSTSINSVQRNPSPCMPEMPGG